MQGCRECVECLFVADGHVSRRQRSPVPPTQPSSDGQDQSGPVSGTSTVSSAVGMISVSKVQPGNARRTYMRGVFFGDGRHPARARQSFEVRPIQR